MAVSSHGEGLEEMQLAPLGPGDYFGEIGLLEQIDRTATVTANCPSRVLRIGGEQFLDALTSAAASSAPLEGSRTRLARTHPTHGATRHARPEDLPV
jgi:CRP-like cAMP-binding protein